MFLDFEKFSQADRRAVSTADGQIKKWGTKEKSSFSTLWPPKRVRFMR